MNQIVTANLSDAPEINPNDIAVDTTPDNEEEKKLQDDVVNAMEKDEELATVDKPEVQNSGEEVKTPQADEEYGLINVDEEQKVEEKAEEKKELTTEELKQIEEQARKKAFDEYVEKYKPNEQKGENIRLYKENEQLKERTLGQDISTYLITEKQAEIYSKFCDSHQDIIPSASKNNLLAYQKTGEEKLIKEDAVLSKLDKQLRMIAQVNTENSLVDLDERLESAFWLAFKDEIIGSKAKQIRAELEIKKQQVDKVVENGQKPTSATKGKSYTSEQQKVAEVWGVKLN